MGDKSPKNIHKQEDQKAEAKLVKEMGKVVNAEVQQHPHSGHPPTEEEQKDPELAANDKEVI